MRLQRLLPIWPTLVLTSACGGSQSLSSFTSGETSEDPASADDDDASSQDEGPDANEPSTEGAADGLDGGPPPGDLPTECGGISFIFNQPITRQIWVVDNSVGTLVPFDHDDDPSTPDLTARERITDFLDWMLPRYPDADGCGTVLPSIMFYPGGDAGLPLGGDACTVAPPTMSVLESSPSLTLDAWQARPEADGANAATQALALAASEGLGGIESWETNRVVMLMGSPPSCGADSESFDPSFEALVASLVDDYDIEVMLINLGPRSGNTGVAIDGRPDEVDLQGFWNGLGFQSPNYNLTPDAPFVLDWLQAKTPDSQPSCLLELGPNPAPGPAQVTPALTINGVPYYELATDAWYCAQDDAPTGFVWTTDDYFLRLCGEACDAVACAERPPFPDNGLVIDVPYLCED